MRETKTWLPFTRSLNGCGDYTPAVFDCHQGCLSRENEERTRERLISSGINTIQPRVHIDFTQSRLVVIAAVFVSRIMKGRPTTGPVWALKKKYTYIRFMFRFR